MGIKPKITILYASIVLLISSNIIFSWDNAHFYRASYFYGEPRFEKKYLTSFDIYFGGGSTCQGIRCNCEKTCLLDIYGKHNMQLLGKNVPGKDLSKQTDIILEMLSEEPKRDCFGHFSFRGEFEINELYFLYTQNIPRGFFFQINVPFRKLSICRITYCDLSPRDEMCPNIDNIYWQSFLNLFDDILKDYKLDIKDFCCKGVGDICFLVGWTQNFEDTEYIDYIDTTFKAGVLAPSAKKRNPNKVFSLPLGYDGHIGFPIIFDGSLGLYEWLTIGAHVDFTYFACRNKTMRLKTDPCQSGFIKLAKDCVCLHKGALWNAGFYVKADHVVGGLSLLAGYTFSTKQKDHIKATPSCIDCAIANCDEMLAKWEMHTIHLLIEYDFTKEGKKFGPRIGAFYNRCVSGKRIFKTSVGGGTFGFEINYDY